MRICLYVLLALASLNALASDKTQPASCQYSGHDYAVKIDKSQHPTPAPAEGKAMLYIMNTGIPALNETTLFIDGKMAGGTRQHSYFFVELDPGEHHICYAARFHMMGTAATSLTMESGKTYFLEQIMVRDRGVRDSLRLAESGPDQAQLILKKLHFGTTVKR